MASCSWEGRTSLVRLKRPSRISAHRRRRANRLQLRAASLQGLEQLEDRLALSTYPPPISSVGPLPATTTSTSFTVSWSGSDVGGPGIASYAIYFSTDGGPFQLFQVAATPGSAIFTGQVGHTYGFYSVATDNAGDVESTPGAAEATIRVISAATISGVTVDWGLQTAALQTASDGVRLLPAGRKTDLPWLNISSVAVTLSQAATLSSGDVSVVGTSGGNYGPVTVSGSGTSYGITLAKPISTADRVTITIGNSEIATFMRRLDVLPGDTNDDGVVNTTDGVLILNNTTPAHAYQAIYDINGDGVVNMTDFTTYRPLIGTVLPSLPPQLAAGGEGPGNVPLLTESELGSVLAEAIDEWAAAGLDNADLVRLENVSAQIVSLPAGYLGGAAIGGSTIYLSADAAGYGWFVDPAGGTTAKVPAGREDLLTVIMHELGHVLGLGDFDPATSPNDLMAETLATGVRRLPSFDDLPAVLGEAGASTPAVSTVADAVFSAAAQDAERSFEESPRLIYPDARRSII